MSQKLTFLFFLGLFTLLGVLQGTPASAASVYDDVVNYTNPAYIYNSSECGTTRFEYSTNWYSELVLNDSITWNMGTKSTVRANFASTLTSTNGRWGVSVTDFGPTTTTERSEINIWWIDNANAQLTWVNSREVNINRVPNSGNTFHRMTFRLLGSESCNVVMSSYSSTNATAGVISGVDLSTRLPITYLFFANIPEARFNYPSGYEGLPIATTVPPPIEEYPDIPNFLFSGVVDYKAEIRDTNFNTFDGNPFLCADDLAPVIDFTVYSVIDTVETELYTGSQSATIPFSYQFDKLNVDREYKIVGRYDCGDPLIEFPNVATLTFTINRAGLLQQDIFEECLTAEFPFINIDNCVGNIAYVINLISFGTVQFQNNWVLTTGCYNTVVLHSWINLPSQNLCPQFSSTVRNIVTPFITFLLGVITVSVITRRGRDNG